jgi:DNA polymerase-3 subunit epsilon
MLVIGLDFETTGLDPKTCEVTEIGAVAWDTELLTPVSFFHRFVNIKGEITPEILDITGITKELLTKYGIAEAQAFSELEQYLSQSDVYIAQNYKFDKSFLDAALERINIRQIDKKWINTVTHVPYPKKFKHRELTSLAAYHGFINPFPHRAITDVLTMLTVMSHYDFKNILELSQEPVLTLWAKVTFAEKDQAKRAGFYYSGDKKAWYKEILKRDLEAETKNCAVLGFAIEVINNEAKT